MYNLVQVGDNTYYIHAPVKIGVYVENNSDIYLIDSGNDKNAGRKIQKVIEENKWNLKELSTHILMQIILVGTSYYKID